MESFAFNKFNKQENLEQEEPGDSSIQELKESLHDRNEVSGFTQNVRVGEDKYYFELYKRDETGPDTHIYYLSFGILNDGVVLTNAGMNIFRQVADKMGEFIKEVSQKTSIDAIIFIASNNKLTKEQEELFDKLQKDVKEKVKKDVPIFDGFEGERDGRHITIEGGVMEIVENNKTESVPIKDLLIGDSDFLNMQMSNGWVCDLYKFYLKSSELESSGLDQILRKALSQDGKRQREILYKRVLDTQFSDYQYEIVGDKFVVYMNVDKKEDVLKELKKQSQA